MARDSSPFAQRLKALAARASRPTSADSAESAPQHDAAESVSAPLPDDVRPSGHGSAEVDPDEQPTGEFPAVAPSDAPAIDQAPQTSGDSANLYAPAPTASAPMEGPDPAAIAADQSWSTPASDAFSPAPMPLGDAPDPTALEEPAAESTLPWSDAPTPPDPAPAWPVVVPPPPVKPPTSVPAPGFEPPAPPIPPQAVRPIWLDPPSELTVPAPTADVPNSSLSSVVPSGPTLQPPVLPKRDQYEPSHDEPRSDAPPGGTPVDTSSPFDGTAPEASTPEPAADAFIPAPFIPEPVAEPFADSFTPEPVFDTPNPSTPAALNDALALPDDDQALATPDQGSSIDAAQTDGTATGEVTSEAPVDPSAKPDSESGTQHALVTDAIAEPARRLRLTRPGFLKRASDAPSADQDATPVEPTSPDHAAWDSIAETVDGEPATTPFQAATEPGTTHFDVVPDLATTDTPDELATAAVADPGSITSRFRLRRSKSPKGDAVDSAEAPSAAADAPAAIPAAELTPEPTAALLTAQPVPYKPSFTERAALRRRAKSLRGRRDAGLLELGAIVLDQSRFGDPSGGTLVRRRTSELADLDSEIAAIEIALDDERSAETVKQLGVVHCTSCSVLLGPADRFCANCGAAHPGPSDGGSETSAS